MKARRWMCYAVFYAMAICVVVMVKANPGRGYGWAPPLLYAAMSWPFFMWYHCGKFQFAPHYVEPIEQRSEEAMMPRIEVDRPVRRRGPSSLELLRQAHAEHQLTQAAPTERTSKRVPVIQNPTRTQAKPEQPEKSASGKRPTVSKHTVPTVPTALAADAATEHVEAEVADEARDYWQAKLNRRARHPDEYSLPLFPEEEKALNAKVSDDEDLFL